MSEKYQRVPGNQEAERTIEQFAALISKYTYRFHQRAAGLSCAMDMEDIRQELSLIFEKCKRSYDAEKGASFMNFVISAWFNEMNRLMRKDQRNREVGYTMGAQQDATDDEGGFNLFDTINSGDSTPEQNLEAHSSIEHALANLSDPARVLVETLVNPPDAVCAQYDLRERGIVQRRVAGFQSPRGNTQLNLKFLIGLFNIPVDAARRLQKEIEHKVGLAFEM